MISLFVLFVAVCDIVGIFLLIYFDIFVICIFVYKELNWYNSSNKVENLLRERCALARN